MKLIYGISRWTDANSDKRLHIPNEHDGLPMCLKKSTKPYRQHVYETVEADGPTCKKCLKKVNDEKG